MLIGSLTAFAVISAALHIRAEYEGARPRVYLFKPLTVVLLIAIAFQSSASAYKYLVVAGLLFSLAGDIFLMLPRDRFIAGLLSFLIAHLFYIAAFTIDGRRGGRLSLLSALLLLIYGGVMLRMLFPYLGKMKLPVIIYMLVILMMVWQASNRWLSTGMLSGSLALAGACLFAVSDSALALDRFRKSFKSAQLLILPTYYAAQWLIALSVALHF